MCGGIAPLLAVLAVPAVAAGFSLLLRARYPSAPQCFPQRRELLRAADQPPTCVAEDQLKNSRWRCQYCSSATLCSLLALLSPTPAALSACNPGLGLPPSLLLILEEGWLSFAQPSHLLPLLAELRWGCGDTQGPG